MAEEQEFEESDILFREITFVAGDFPARSVREPGNVADNENSSSVPINIPEPKNRLVVLDFGGDGEFVPPHVVIGRRVAGKVMAFSLCTGDGRTLKGRALSDFRNSILRMTGFLEA